MALQAGLDRLAIPLAAAARAFVGRRAWGRYAEERLRMSRSTADKRVRLARALRRLRRAHQRGWVGFESALLVVQATGREALPEEAEWVGSSPERRPAAGRATPF